MGQEVVPNHCITPIFNLPALKPQIIIDSNGDLPIGAQVALRCLNRRVPQEELDLLQIPAALAAQLGASPSQVVSPEALDPDLLR